MRAGEGEFHPLRELHNLWCRLTWSGRGQNRYAATGRGKGVQSLNLLLENPARLALAPFIFGLGGLCPLLVAGGAIAAMALSLPMTGPTTVDSGLVEDVYLAGFILIRLSLPGVVGALLRDLLRLFNDPRTRVDGAQ